MLPSNADVASVSLSYFELVGGNWVDEVPKLLANFILGHVVPYLESKEQKLD